VENSKEEYYIPCDDVFSSESIVDLRKRGEINTTVDARQIIRDCVNSFSFISYGTEYVSFLSVHVDVLENVNVDNKVTVFMFSVFFRSKQSDDISDEY
jgi:hypothetical protein